MLFGLTVLKSYSKKNNVNLSLFFNTIMIDIKLSLNNNKQVYG